jgi:hypothetical protein
LPELLRTEKSTFKHFCKKLTLIDGLAFYQCSNYKRLLLLELGMQLNNKALA